MLTPRRAWGLSFSFQTQGHLQLVMARMHALSGTVIASDQAGQFHLGDHALCWARAERLVYKLLPTTDAQHRAVVL